MAGKQFHFDENKKAYNISNLGNGNPNGRHFQDSDDMYTLAGFNVIEHGESAAFNNAETVFVDNSKADRGKES